MVKKIILVALCAITIFIILLFNYVPAKHANHGKLDLQLYLGDSLNQPLVVAFGGGEGGNAWAHDRWKSTRDQFIDKGYAFLAIGYFGSETSPTFLDRISLNAIYDSIMNISTHPSIDASKIALIGGSKGGELVLNLASRYEHFGAVVAIVPSHVSFPALTAYANTSSWEFNGEEVIYAEAPFKTIFPAIAGDLHAAFSIMLEDAEEVEKSRIKVEEINGPILLLSATEDEMWPSTYMCDEVVNRLNQNQFNYYYEHIAIEGEHSKPLDYFDEIFNFLDKQFISN